jgi:hypothetical protein
MMQKTLALICVVSCAWILWAESWSSSRSDQRWDVEGTYETRQMSRAFSSAW